MRVKPLVVHFFDGVNVVGNIQSSVSVTGNGGAHKVDDIEATPVGVLIRAGAKTSLIPWGSVRACPDVEVIDEKREKGK